MNEDPKSKPVRELLQDISGTNESTRVPPRGLISLKLADRIAFFSSIVCLLLVAATFISMIWNGIDEAFGFRCIGSIVVVMGTILLLRAVNAQYE